MLLLHEALFPHLWKRSLKLGKTLKEKLGQGHLPKKGRAAQRCFADRPGKRRTKCFAAASGAWTRLADTEYAEQHGTVFVPADGKADVRFECWTEHVAEDLAPGTRRSCRERYAHSIQTVIGKMQPVSAKRSTAE